MLRFCALNLSEKLLYRGSALLTALFIMTLVAILTTGLSKRNQTDIQRTRTIIGADQLKLASDAATFWAMDRLADPKQILTQMGPQHQVLTLPKSLQSITPGIKIYADLFDLQGKLNINSLYDDDYEAIALGLLSELQIGASGFERKDLMASLKYWLLPANSEQSNHDSWSDKYAKQKPPYLPAHMPMNNPSELRLVYGFSARRYQKMAPFISALPEATPINVNTASKTLLLALATGIKDSDVNNLINQRQQKPYKDLNVLNPLLQKYHIQSIVLTTESRYFLLITTATDEKLTIQFYTVLTRFKDKSGLWQLKILSQSINTL